MNPLLIKPGSSPGKGPMMEDSGGQESFLSQSALQIFQNELQVVNCPLLNKTLFFLIFGLRIFFSKISRSEEGKK